MNTNTINQLPANQTYYSGCFARDKIPLKFKKPATLIVNTDVSTSPGEHWIAIHLTRENRGEYFDPYGLPPLHNDLQAFLFKQCPAGIVYNPRTLQCLECITCGHYCVAYVKSKAAKLTFCKFLSKFTSDQYLNEKIVKGYIAHE